MQIFTQKSSFYADFASCIAHLSISLVCNSRNLNLFPPHPGRAAYRIPLFWQAAVCPLLPSLTSSEKLRQLY
jgi:hypothetical protein